MKAGTRVAIKDGLPDQTYVAFNTGPNRHFAELKPGDQGTVCGISGERVLVLWDLAVKSGHGGEFWSIVMDYVYELPFVIAGEAVWPGDLVAISPVKHAPHSAHSIKGRFLTVKKLGASVAEYVVLMDGQTITRHLVGEILVVRDLRSFLKWLFFRIC